MIVATVVFLLSHLWSHCRMLSYTNTYVAMTKADRTTQRHNDRTTNWQLKSGGSSKWHLSILCQEKQVSCLATCWPDVDVGVDVEKKCVWRQ